MKADSVPGLVLAVKKMVAVVKAFPQMEAFIKEICGLVQDVEGTTKPDSKVLDVWSAHNSK